MSGAALKLIALVVPLGLDTLSVSLALGIAGLPRRRRVRIALLFAGFEASMPLIGVALGAALGNAIGDAADFAAAVLVAAVGLYMLVSRDGANEGVGLLSMTERGIAGAALLGLSISLDELAIGFSAGLLRLPLVPLVCVIAVQAFAATMLGTQLGARLGEGAGDSAERLAGIALISLGAVLLILHLTR